MKNQEKTKEQLVTELAELRQLIAELKAGETEPKRVEQAILDRRTWLFPASMFVLLGILVWLNEILDLPRLLGASQTPINWREAIIETVAIIGAGLFAVSMLIRNVAERKRAEEALKEYSERLAELVEERTQELRDAQEQMLRREKLAVLGQLAGGVGHDLRNPLGVISNAVYFLKMVHTGADETTREYLDIIKAEVMNAETIVSDLMDFARTREPAIEQTSIPVLIADLLAQYPPPENVKVDTELPADLPPVFVDPQQVKRALVNLVTNAYQAMPEGGRLMIHASEGEGIGRHGDTGTGRPRDDLPIPPSPCLRVSISDTGSGIPPENVTRLFEPLFTTKSKGVGLGLATARSLVEANGGMIEVESKMGKGSTFTVQLPSRGKRKD